jgi:hypothetical protein
MNCFSNDADLLRYEPKLFTEFYFPSQVLTSGTGGVLAGTTFSAGGADFIAAGISAGGVIYLKSTDGVLDGAFEIISADSAGQLTVSVLRADQAAGAVAPPAAADAAYRVSTFAPQANEAMAVLMRCFGIEPQDSANLARPDELRQASVFMVLSSVYATLTGNEQTSEEFWKKSLHYRTLFEQLRQQIRLSIDADGDGASEECKEGSEIRLIRK